MRARPWRKARCVAARTALESLAANLLQRRLKKEADLATVKVVAGMDATVETGELLLRLRGVAPALQAALAALQTEMDKPEEVFRGDVAAHLWKQLGDLEEEGMKNKRKLMRLKQRQAKEPWMQSQPSRAAS